MIFLAVKMKQEQKNGFFSRNWKIILGITILIILIILFIKLSGKKSISPDLVYFPT